MLIFNIILNGRNKLSNIILIGLVIIIIFFPAIYGNSIKDDIERDIFIDPSLNLNHEHIPLLQHAIQKCKNHTISTILIKIVEKLQQIENLNANDLEKIIRELRISPLWISFLKPISGDSNGGKFFCFPGLFFAYFFGYDWTSFNEIYLPYIGPSIILLGQGDINIYRFISIIEADLYAIIGFFGIVRSFAYEHFGGFEFAGIGFLTFAISF